MLFRWGRATPVARSSLASTKTRDWSRAPPAVMLTVRDAHARVIAAFEALPAEMVSVADAAGRVLAVSPEARLTQPPADLSAMDGYA
ncbi:MAG TPA: molybdopterin molybdenumtransferase MoeA, partial [Reyranella sp.]|nr:molybdopterin molybdenumtransferase MoeA [Reyranella sp.]